MWGQSPLPTSSPKPSRSLAPWRVQDACCMNMETAQVFWESSITGLEEARLDGGGGYVWDGYLDGTRGLRGGMGDENRGGDWRGLECNGVEQ